MGKLKLLKARKITGKKAKTTTKQEITIKIKRNYNKTVHWGKNEKTFTIYTLPEGWTFFKYLIFSTLKC